MHLLQSKKLFTIAQSYVKGLDVKLIGVILLSWKKCLMFVPVNRLLHIINGKLFLVKKCLKKVSIYTQLMITSLERTEKVNSILNVFNQLVLLLVRLETK